MADLLYGPANAFVWHPLRGLVVAAAFAAAFGALRLIDRARRGRWLLLVTAAAWLGFAYHEHLAHRYGWDIRIDLLVTWPALVGLSLAALTVSLVTWHR